jgi:uncharacterized protein
MKLICIKLARKPLASLLVIIILTIVFIAAIATNGKLETNLNAYMPSSHPAFIFSDYAESLFGIQDSILIAIENPDSIYNAGTLKKIKEITEQLPIEFAEIDDGGVTSLYTADNIIGSEWGMEIEAFYNEIPETDEDLAAIRANVEANEMVYGRNVSMDGNVTLILAKLNTDELSDDFHAKIAAFASRWEGPETIHIAGRPIVEGALAELGPQDMLRMAPIVLALMTILLLILLRSIRDTLINLIIVLFGTVTSFGVMALMNVPIYAVDTMIPVMLIAIGVAYGIHMHNSIHLMTLDNPSITRVDLVDKVMRAMIRPVVMAAITTAIGFSALMTSQVLPVRYFGFFASIGVMTEMILALILFPASIYLFGPPKTIGRKSKKLQLQNSPSLDQTIKPNKLAKSILQNPKTVIFTGVLLVAVAIFGSTKVWIDTSFLANFEEDSPIVQTDDFINTYFGGTSSLNIILTAADNDVFKQPEVLALLDTVQQTALEEPMVGAGFSLVDFIKRMNRVMNNNDPAFNTVPEDQELIAQYLLLFELSGDPEAMDRVVDYDYRVANLTLQLKSDSSAVMSGVIDRIEGFESQFKAYGITLQYAGSGYKALVFSDLLLEGQIISLALSFIIVAILLSILFRNILIGIAGTIPIAITAVVNFGVMGLVGIPLSSATALISSIAIGIGVDYAIHLIEHYRLHRLEGFGIQESAFETLAHTGRAIIYNAIAVMGGFAVLTLSVFPPNRQVGSLIVLNMATSAIGTLTILMVIIVALDRKGKFIHEKPGILPSTILNSTGEKK